MSVRPRHGLLVPRVFLGAVALVAAAVVSLPASSATPNLEGFWWPGRAAADSRMPELTSKLPAKGAAIRDLGAPSRTGGNFGELDVKEAARAAAMKWNPMDEETVANVCKPPSIIYGMPGPFPFEIYQSDKLIVFRLEYYDQVRVVFLDGRSHPGSDYPHTTVGHSIGRWEGDTLVVDTTHLASSTMMGNGLRHSDDVHLVERFRLTPDGKNMHWTQDVEDPQVLNNHGIRYSVMERRKGNNIPYECDPSYGQSIQQRGGQEPAATERK
ncbi:MAG: hypothetical protein ABIQ86_15735 [Steroidobacteraceae bacterium]